MNNFTPISYKGKPYFTVATRVAMVHASGKSFEICSSEPLSVGDRCIWKVVIRVGDVQYVGNAEVKLNAAKNTADGQNPFECAETSAIGRALGFAGFGSIDSIATVDEIVRSQEQPKQFHPLSVPTPYSTQPLEDVPTAPTETINFENSTAAERPIASPPPLATAQQKDALAKLCKAKRQQLPRNFRDMSEDDAKAWIKSLQKMKVTVQPEPMGFYPRSEEKAIAAPLNGSRAFSLMR